MLVIFLKSESLCQPKCTTYLASKHWRYPDIDIILIPVEWIITILSMKGVAK